MDYYDQGEFTIENKRIVPSFKKNGEIVHDLFCERIMKSEKNRRISFWISRMTNKSRKIFRELINKLEKDRIIRKEQKKFLNIIPYYRYWFNDSSVRSDLIETLRGILLYGKQPGKKELMLLGLVETSKSYTLLSRESGESKLLRKKNTEFLKSDIISAEISLAMREVQAAIVASVTAATIAAHSSH